MQEVKVKRTDLLDRVSKNRDAHQAVFERALGDYEKAVILELQEWLADALAGKRVQRKTVLIQPQDHTKDYNRVIDMIEMSVDDEIVLDAHSFMRYVRDEWEWFGQFTETMASNSMYLASRS